MTPTARADGSTVETEGEMIQLWTASLDSVAQEAGRDGSLLSEGELERAGRLRFEVDRARFVASRVWLRLILAARLGVGVSEIRLQTAAGGKPELAPPLPEWLRFSMSRSASLGLYALARNQEVGVDLEACSQFVDVEAVGRRFFSAGERGVLARLAGEQRQRGFYRIWTRKEAVLKSAGVGLDTEVTELDVSGDVAHWNLALPGLPATGRSWFVHDLDVAPGYSAALAFEATRPLGVPVVRDAAELLQDLDR